MSKVRATQPVSPLPRTTKSAGWPSDFGRRDKKAGVGVGVTVAVGVTVGVGMAVGVRRAGGVGAAAAAGVGTKPEPHTSRRPTANARQIVSNESDGRI
jgi:hypothetical protein